MQKQIKYRGEWLTMINENNIEYIKVKMPNGV